MTKSSDFDVLCVGNAIVDVIAPADEAFVEWAGVPLGGMTLIDEARAHEIYDAMAPGREVSGGSAANTSAALASLGGTGAFIGKVRDDALGEIFRHDLRAAGIAFDTTPASEGPATGRCLVHVTPDGQRSMTTFLGAAGGVTPDDIDPALVARAAILYFEGYLFEQESPRAAFMKACDTARAVGVRAALTLSDSGVVERNHTELLSFIGERIDILFANEAEIIALTEAADFDAALSKARGLAQTLVLTRSEKGSVIVEGDTDPVVVLAKAPETLLDTTGAGDAYAAGYLFGAAQGMDAGKAGALGSLAATEVISHYGARPETRLSTLAREDGLLA